MSKKTEIYELIPTNGRASFYRKAKVIVVGKRRYLLSYETIVGGIDEKGKAHRYSDYRSKTTSSHVKAFFDDPMAFWKLPIEKQPKITVIL